jgi:hypothetical protein
MRDNHLPIGKTSALICPASAGTGPYMPRQSLLDVISFSM